MKLIFHPEAEQDQYMAVRWYLKEGGPRLARRFEDDLDTALHQIATTPRLFPEAIKGRRRALLTIFPYAVIFEETDEAIAVLAIAHTSRRPFYWGTRRI